MAVLDANKKLVFSVSHHVPEQFVLQAAKYLNIDQEEIREAIRYIDLMGMARLPFDEKEPCRGYVAELKCDENEPCHENVAEWESDDESSIKDQPCESLGLEKGFYLNPSYLLQTNGSKLADRSHMWLCCCNCGSAITNVDQILSHDHTWQLEGEEDYRDAYFVNSVALDAIKIYKPKEETLVQGVMTVSRVDCKCGAELGWKFVEAIDPAEKFSCVNQEGRFGLVKAQVKEQLAGQKPQVDAAKEAKKKRVKKRR